MNWKSTKREISKLPYKKNQTILPGETHSKIPRITNYARPCWVQATCYENQKKEQEGFHHRMLWGISEEWVKRGEYYYYTEVLNRGESVDLFGHQDSFCLDRAALRAGAWNFNRSGGHSGRELFAGLFWNVSMGESKNFGLRS